MFSSKTKYILVLLGVAILATALIRFELPSGMVNAQNGDELSLHISREQRRFLRFEPIALNLKLSNETLTPIRWSGILDFGKSINFLIRSSNGAERIWKGDRGFDDRTSGVHVMQTGNFVEVQRLIGDNFSEQLFPGAGQYQVRVEFEYVDSSSGELESKTALSNVVNIEIIEPTGKERAAYQYLKNVLGPVIDGNNRTEEVRIRQYFSGHFSDSVYWKYKAFELANIYMRLGQYANAEDEFFNISDIDYYHSKRVKAELEYLAGELRRPVPRSKRVRILTNIPVAVPISVPPTAIVLNPPPANGPVLIPIPSPTP